MRPGFVLTTAPVGVGAIRLRTSHRTADDAIGDLHALLESAGVEPPYVMVGSSFGGFVATYYAATFADEVVGVVLLDVPAPDATLTAALIPEIAWDHPTNLEHVDAGPEFRPDSPMTPCRSRPP